MRARELEYEIKENTYSSVEVAYHAIYEEKMSHLDSNDSEKIFHDFNHSEDRIILGKPEKGILIFSGKCFGVCDMKSSFYYLANITDDYIYTMEIIYSLASTKREALHQAYVIDCLYRYCSFNGSTNEDDVPELLAAKNLVDDHCKDYPEDALLVSDADVYT